MGWRLPSGVQAECIPLILGGGDVMAAAETGTGKTGSFCLPLVQIVHETLRDPNKGFVAGGGGGGEKGAVSAAECQMSSSDRDAGFAVSPDGLSCQARDQAAWFGGRATVGVWQGRYYFEATVADEGLGRVGWSTRTAKFDLGTDASGFGYGATGKKSYNRKFEDYGGPYALNDTVGCYVDCDAGVVGFTRNGVDLGKAFDVPKYMRGHVLYPAAVLKNAETRFNFGATPFRHAPPPGYVGVCGAPVAHTAAGLKDVAAAGQKRGGDGHKAPAPARRPLALILEPTLELATQTHEELLRFTAFLPEPRLKIGLFLGGKPQQPQLDVLRGGVDVVTGTPQRLLDLVASKAMDVSGVRFLVLDEADRLMEAGMFRVVEQLYDALDQARLQVLMFSATLHGDDVERLAQRVCRHPTWVDLKGRDSVPQTVLHVRVTVDPSRAPSVLGGGLLRHGPSFDIATDGVHTGDPQARVVNSKEHQSETIKLLKARYLVELINVLHIEQAIIFIRTRVDAAHLEAYLNRLSSSEYSCLQLHAGKGTDTRLANLDTFKRGDVRFLIATDVAARGIDIKELPYVINYTLPDKPEDYIHRVGRVGRAGAPGLAISLVASAEEKVWYHSCGEKKDKCRNTKLAAKGGCCIWYNEPALVTAIEDRLSAPIAVVSEADGFRMPERAVPAAPGGIGGGGLTAEAEKQRLELHSGEIAPLVKNLVELERQLSLGFFGLKR